MREWIAWPSESLDSKVKSMWSTGAMAAADNFVKVFLGLPLAFTCSCNHSAGVKLLPWESGKNKGIMQDKVCFELAVVG